MLAAPHPLRRRSAAGSGGTPICRGSLLLVVFTVWELFNYLVHGSRADHPTFSSITDANDRFYLLKSLLFFGWLAAGMVIVRQGGPPMSVSTASYVVWGVIGALALVLWWLSYVRPSAVAHPSDVVGKIATHPVGRVVLVVGFMWLGWHLFAR